MERKNSFIVRSLHMLRKELIYDLMLGMYNLTQFHPPESDWVCNEFQAGTLCAKLSAQIYHARVRLGERLDTDSEDPDILDIVNAYEELQKYLALQMFEYGRRCEGLPD